MFCQNCQLKPIQDVVTIQGAQLCVDCAMAAVPGEVARFNIPLREIHPDWLRGEAEKDSARANAVVAPVQRLAA
jgi:hypothetical protein